MRLIDADALKKTLNEFDDSDHEWWYEALIDDQPTVDAVQVVRCKDCSRRSMEAFRKSTKSEEEYLCRVWHTGGVKPDDFCSYGVRKEEAE